MSDMFSTHTSGLDSPARSAFAITPSDSAAVGVVTRGLYSGAGGTIVCILAGDADAVTFTNVPAGVVLPLRIKQVLSTGTTATGLVGLF